VNVLELERLSYRYPGAARPALHDVTLSIAPGELVVLAGASGSGKSTLLRSASGLVPHFYGGVLAGRVLVAGLDTREHGPGELARAVGTLFQDPETQVVMGTVRAELAFGLENQGELPAALARGVEEAALALGIGHLLHRPTAELSGGELQRVALAAAIAGKPPLIVLDEPTSQLDPVAGDELLGLLRRLNEDTDAAIVISEHRLERCLGAADRVIALDDGRVVCDAPPARFLEWAVASAQPLCTPGARLLSSLGLPPAAGVKPSRALLRANGLLPDAADAIASAAEGRQPVPGGAGGPWARARAAGAEAAAGLRRGRREARAPAALRFDRVWHELRGGAAILRGVSLSIAPGERVALMGRNGAGKSTLLRHAAGLLRPSRGRVQSAGRVALLLQHPGDYLVHDTVSAEAPPGALASVGLDPDQFGRRHPRDLSGGEKQRLALAIVLGDRRDRAAVVCLDEPTRGMDRALKSELAALLASLDAAILVATHDPEFVAAFAQRVVLLADGAPIADGDVAQVLARGTYFATETARILGGAGGALTPEQGASLLAHEAAVSA